MKARSVPLTIREKVEPELDQLVAPSITKPVDFSEWVSAIIPVILMVKMGFVEVLSRLLILFYRQTSIRFWI